MLLLIAEFLLVPFDEIKYIFLVPEVWNR